jgi:IS5 family transposase
LTVAIAADMLLDRVATGAILHGDKGYDSDAIRRKIESKGAAPNIPPKANRR